MMRQPPAPIVRISRSMGVCCTSHHLHPSNARCERWGMLRQPPPPPIVPVSRSMGVCCPPVVRISHSMGVCCTSHHSTHCSRLAFDGCMLCQPPPPPIVHVLRSMGVCCPPPVVRILRSMGVAVPTTTSTRRLPRGCSYGFLSFAYRVQ